MNKLKEIQVSNTKYTWSDFDKDCDSLEKQIRKSLFSPNIICGIISGGLPLATKLSNSLKKPLNTTLIDIKNGVARRDFWILDSLDEDKNILFVNDASMHGSTIKWILGQYTIKKRNKIGQVRFTSLAQLPNQTYKSDFYAREKKEKECILFPWEIKQ